MATCKDCIHNEICRRLTSPSEFIKLNDIADDCNMYKDKSLYGKLPCKVGQQVYRIYTHYEQPIFSWIITEIRILEDEIIFIDDSDNEMKIDEIGKTVFLTKEDAEKALLEREKK